MVLKLSIPGRRAEGQANVATRPSETRRWLANLPALDPTEARRLLREALYTLNRLELADRTRFKLLELYREHVAITSREIEKRQIGLSVPLPRNSEAIVNQIRDLHIEMAFGYKALVLNAARASSSRRRLNKTALATAIHRAIRYLAEILRRSYQSYAPYPDGTWFEIHQLYQYARSRGILTKRVEDPLNELWAASDILHIYKLALLLGLSDPYQLPYRTVDWVYVALESWVGLARLQGSPIESKDSCQFVIDLDSDRPGEPCLPNTQGKDAERHIILDTTELTIAIHAQLSGQAEGSNLKLGQGELNRDQIQEMLYRLIIRWGVGPVRRFSRTQTRGTWELTTGLNTVYYFLNGGGDLGGDVGDPVVTGIPGDYRSEWASGNESATGLFLSLDKPVDVQLRVGQLVAVRPIEQGTEWAVGVIRWVKSSGPGNIEVGIEKMGPGARAATVKSVPCFDLEIEGRRSMMAIVVPEIKALERRQTLITPKGIFKPQGTLVMEMAGDCHMIQATRVIESVRSFDWFEFAIFYWDDSQYVRT